MGPDEAPAGGATVAGTAGHVSTSFRELTDQECDEHLSTESMGRIAWSAGGLQHILPVSYGMHGGQVVFRTSPYGALSHLQKHPSVAFEIDHADPATGTGWSVVVQGHVRAVVRPQELATLWAGSDPEPWAPGTRNVFIAIVAQSVTGRQVEAPFTG